MTRAVNIGLDAIPYGPLPTFASSSTTATTPVRLSVAETFVAPCRSGSEVLPMGEPLDDSAVDAREQERVSGGNRAAQIDRPYRGRVVR
jgi:hypothetical protein